MNASKTTSRWPSASIDKPHDTDYHDPLYAYMQAVGLNDHLTSCSFK